MARRKRHEEHDNNERWLVSYADFITLLFAFFVVMYAVSSVNEGKYRTLSDSMMAAFSGSTRSAESVPVDEPVRTQQQTALPINQTPKNMPLPDQTVDNDALRGADPELEQVSDSGDKDAAEAHSLKRMSDQIVEQMRPLMQQGLIYVRRTSLWLEVEINNNILFPSGSAQMNSEAESILRQLAGILQPFPNPIRVEGFTDNIPIKNRAFESNWELSAGRAAQVVRLFAEAGVDPVRMAAVGFGQYRPVADNETADGRSKNRRVALVVLAGADSRYLMDIARDKTEIKLDVPPSTSEDGP